MGEPLLALACRDWTPTRQPKCGGRGPEGTRRVAGGEPTRSWGVGRGTALVWRSGPTPRL